MIPMIRRFLQALRYFYKAKQPTDEQYRDLLPPPVTVSQMLLQRRIAMNPPLSTGDEHAMLAAAHVRIAQLEVQLDEALQTIKTMESAKRESERAFYLAERLA